MLTLFSHILRQYFNKRWCDLPFIAFSPGLSVKIVHLFIYYCRIHCSILYLITFNRWARQMLSYWRDFLGLSLQYTSTVMVVASYDCFLLSSVNNAVFQCVVVPISEHCAHLRIASFVLNALSVFLSKFEWIVSAVEISIAERCSAFELQNSHCLIHWNIFVYFQQWE